MPDTKQDNGSTNIPDRLISLGQYEWPQGEAQQTLTRVFEIVKSEFPWAKATKENVGQELHSVDEADAIAAAHDKLTDILFTCLDSTFLDWCQDTDGRPELRAFVHAPMSQELLLEWARSRGVTSLSCLDDLPAKGTETCVVIPNLDIGVLRSPTELQRMKDVIARLANAEIKIILGCNSWVWRYLNGITSLAMVTTSQHTVPAFGAPSLSVLIEGIVGRTRDVTLFVSEESGDPIFERDENGALKDPYFTKLAKRSLGLPWVAIELFFDDTQIADEAAQNDSKADLRTWVRLPTTQSIPKDHKSLVCLAFQNLLIHEPCTAETLMACLPQPLPIGALARLVSEGFILKSEENLRHNPSHYPAIRSALSTAGLNLDQL